MNRPTPGRIAALATTLLVSGGLAVASLGIVAGTAQAEPTVTAGVVGDRWHGRLGLSQGWAA
jgi:hypothetical protein